MYKVSKHFNTIILIGLLILLLNRKIYGKINYRHDSDLFPISLDSHENERFINDYYIFEDGDDANEADNEDENENEDDDAGDEDDEDDNEDNDTSKNMNNVKRDLIKGPSYIPTINDDIADTELERENYENEPGISGGSKRKYIPDEALTDSNKITATENDVSDAASLIESPPVSMDADESSREKDSTSLKEEELNEKPRETSRSITTRKNKGKISVMVNVNINERAARRSKVEVANKTLNVAAPVQASSGAGAGSGDNEENSEASGFLQHYGALQIKSDSVDDYPSTSKPKVKTLKKAVDDSETSSGSGASESNTHTDYSNVPAFHPKNSTLSIFAGPAYPKHNEMKILNIASTGILDSDEEENESTSKDTVLGSGSGESEDDVSIHDHPTTKQLRKLAAANIAAAAGKTAVVDKPTSKQKTANAATPVNDETAEAERGETPDTVFANKMAADQEEKNNELEHNDKSTESLTQFKISQAKDFNKEQEAEVTGKSEKIKEQSKQSKPDDNDIRANEKEMKEKFSKEGTSNSEDNDDDLSEAPKEKVKPDAPPKPLPKENEKKQNSTKAGMNVKKLTEKNNGPVVNNSKQATEPSLQEMSETPGNKAVSGDVLIEQVKEKTSPKAIPKEATVNKDTDQNDNQDMKMEHQPSVAANDHEDANEETLSKNELKIDADNSVPDDGKDNIKKASNNDDKYETLEEVREKFKKWETHLKEKTASAVTPKNSTETVSEKEKSKVNLVKSEENEKVTADGESNAKSISTAKSIKDNKIESATALKIKEDKKLTDEERDKAEKLKEIEEEKQESESAIKPKVTKSKGEIKEGQKLSKKEDQAKTWKEEEKLLLDKLKNPYLDENSKLKKYKDEDEEEEEDELKKEINNKANKEAKIAKDAAEKKQAEIKTEKEKTDKEEKEKASIQQAIIEKNEKEAEKIKEKTESQINQAEKEIDAKIHSQANLKVDSYKNEQGVKNLKPAVKKDFKSVLKNTDQDKDKEVEKGKDLDHKSSVTDNSSNEKFSGDNVKLGEKNLKQLAKFKAQILNEVSKIDNLQAEYGKDTHSTKDLFEAKEVLQKDLKVVKELENSLLKKSASSSSNVQTSAAPQAVAKKVDNNVSKQQKKKHQVLTSLDKVNSDLIKSASSVSSATNSDLGVDKNPIDKLDGDEIIPEAKLGFDAETEEEKAQEVADERLAVEEEEKLFQSAALAEKQNPVAQKQKPKIKSNSYEHEFYAKNKNHKEMSKHKKKHHPLEDIHALLKAEIKRLRVKKTNHKSDAQLTNIRRLVQQRLKSMLSTGELDKSAFHSLAPEIKELGSLLKHKIKNENKKLRNKHVNKNPKKRPFKTTKHKTNHDLNHLVTNIGHKDLDSFQGNNQQLSNENQSPVEHIRDIAPAKVKNRKPLESFKFQKKPGEKPAAVPVTSVNSAETETEEHEGVLPHIKNNSKEKLDQEMLKDMKELNMNNQDVFQKIQKTHPEQSNKMKTLLTTLNQKLGEIYSKASKAQTPVAQVSPPQAVVPPSFTQTPQQPQAKQPQQQQQQQQRQESSYPAANLASAASVAPAANVAPVANNVSSYQSRLAGDAGNELPAIYIPQTFSAPANPAVASPAGVGSAATAATSSTAETVASAVAAAVPASQVLPQAAASSAMYQNPQVNPVSETHNQAPQGKTELPPVIATQPEEEIDIEDTDQPKALADDEPVDTLVESLERDITEVWSYRDMFPDADSLGLDNEKVHNTYANLGSLSGLSLRRALKRALRGEDVGLAVVGGSISKGGPFSEKGLDFVLRSYFYAVEDYWNKIIRPVTGSSMIIRDVSIGGIATDYYSYCLQNHLADDKLTNIVLWELSANDMRRYEDGLRPKPQPLEQFARNVLSYKAKPALIFVNFFALFDWDPDLSAHCRNYEDEGEDDVARYYKITSLSWRNMVCPLLRSGTEPLFTRSKLFAEDNFHPSILGHAQMSYIIIDYIRTEFLKNLVKMRNTNIANAVTQLQIPKSIYIPRPMYTQTYLWKPLCHTYMLVDNRSPNNTLPMDEESNGNFRYTVVREFKIRSDKIVGMETQSKDQYLSYKMHIPAHRNGGKEPYKRLGIMTFTDNRQAQVQFDADNPLSLDSNKKFLEGTLIKYVAENVSPGEHQLTIKSGSSGFLVCALVLG